MDYLGVTTAKKRNYSCQSCSKAYIGRGGLSRHYRTHPSHGSLAEGEDVSTQGNIFLKFVILCIIDMSFE